MSFIDDWNNQANAQVAQTGQSHSWDDFYRQQQQQALLKSLQDKNTAAAAPKGNFLTSLLPTGGGIGGALAGGATGAAIGSAVPVVGTAIGGLLGAILGGAGGSALGKVGENSVEGESDLGKGVAQEALLGGVTSLPLGAGLKLAGAGFKAATGLGKATAKELVTKAGQSAIPKYATGLQVKAGEDVANTLANSGTQAVTRPTDGIINTLQTAARNTDAKVSGVGTGTRLNGKTITPSRSNELLNYGRSNGVRPGSPAQQAADAEALHTSNTQALSSHLDSINRPATAEDKSAITSSINGKLSSSKGIGNGANNDTQKFLRDVENAPDIKSLEELRMEADDLGYKASGAKDTAAAKQAQIVRTAIDDHITKLFPEYKAAKGNYQNSKDLQELTSLNAKSTKGGFTILGNNFGSQAVPSATSKITNKIAGASGDPIRPLGNAAKDAVDGGAIPPTGGSILTGSGVKTGGQGILGLTARESILGQRPTFSNTGSASSPLDENGLTADDLASLQNNPLFAGTSGNTLGSGTAAVNPADDTNNPFGASLTQVAGALQQAAANGDSKGYATLSDLYDKINAYQTAQTKAASTTSAGFTKPTAQLYSQATSALTSVGQLEKLLGSNPDLVNKAAIPGQNVPLVGGLVSNLAGTGQYKALASNILNSIARINTGANMPESEATFYQQTYLPQPGDTADTITSKINNLKQFFSPIANYQSGDSGIADMLSQYQ